MNWDSITLGTYTKGVENTLPVYGINREMRRKMARTLDTEWQTFTYLLDVDPNTVIKAYEVKRDEVEEHSSPRHSATTSPEGRYKTQKDR